MSETQINAQKIGPSRWFHVLAVALIAAGIFGASKGIAGAVDTLGSGLTRAIFPGNVVVPFSVRGEYDIYYESQSEFGGRVFDTGSKLPGLAFTVTNEETGESIPLRQPGVHATYQLNGRNGQSALQFHVAKPGRYEVEAHYNDNEQHEDAVFAVGDIQLGRFTLLLFGGIFSILILGGAGLALIVVIEIRRESSKRKLRAAAAISGASTPTPLG
ncbi:MAG: hypothetical protein WA755_14110 [Candidatus Acidiferrales bacterium]